MHRDLMRHLAWADDQVWRAILAHPPARIDALTRERVHHVHEVQWAYLHLWRGEAPILRDLDGFVSLDDIRAWGRAFHHEAECVIDPVEAQAEWLNKPLRVPWADQLVERVGVARPATTSESVLQIVLHSTHHRGQINARLRELGGDPPLVDYIVWIWCGRPSPD